MVALKKFHHHVAHKGKKALIALTGSFNSIRLSESKGTIKSSQPVIEKSAGLQVVVVEAEIQEIPEITARKPGVIPKMWTPEEDQILREAVEKYGEKNWREIAREVPQRTHLQCLQRWKKALRPGLVKGHWSKEEDDYLVELMEKYWEDGNWNWAKISDHIPGRNPKQCRERWHLNLDPSINRGPWTDEEDEKLLRLHDEFNGRWSLIAKEMTGRTENSVKTRFHSLQRREVRERGWVKEEDDLFVRGLLTYGRNYTLCARLLPGRSRGQLKKRFPTLLQLRPTLHSQVKEIEAKIEKGYKPTPIHEVLKGLQEERKRKKQVLKQEGNTSHDLSNQPYLDSRYGEQNLASLANTYEYLTPNKYAEKQSQDRFSWMDDIFEQISDPIVSPQLSRRNSTTVLHGIIEENLEVNDSLLYDFSQPFNCESGFSELLPSKESNLVALDKVLQDLEESPAVAEVQPQDWSRPVQSTKSVSGFNYSNCNSIKENGYNAVAFDDNDNDLSAYYDRHNDKRGFAPPCNAQYGGNVWSRLPTIRSGGDFPVL